MIPILIPAAGASSRMRGADKLLMDVDGHPLLQHQVHMALQVSTDVHVALPPRPHARYALVPPQAATVTVAQPEKGLSATLKALFESLKPSDTHALVLLADLPDITPQDLETLLAERASQPDALIWRATTDAGKPGHPMIVAAALFPAFLNLTGDTGGHALLKAHQDDTVLVPLPGTRALADLDTPEDWADWYAKRAT